VVGVAFILVNVKAVDGGSRVAWPKATTKDARKAAKGSKKGKKWHPQSVAIATSNDGDDKEADDSNEEYVTAVKHDFKRQAWQPKDHFEKLFEAACQNHSYPVKHKVKNCTMMKNFMTSGALSRGKKPEGEPRGRWATLKPEEAAVMTIVGWPHPSPGDTSWLPKYWAPNSL
jgi:hypothetical protein